LALKALRAPQHIFAIETILNITAATSVEIFAALFALLALGAPALRSHVTSVTRFPIVETLP
jgi:hypothetical protein